MKNKKDPLRGRYFLLFVLICFLSPSLFSIEVDEEELKTEERVEFTNYTGRQRVYPAEVIKGIGRILSAGLKRGLSRGVYATKYSSVHAYDNSVPEKLGADIIFIEKSAQVNHINSLRLILTGFLETHYGYGTQDAETLSIFATYYNAVYRDNLAYFSDRYQPAVLTFITAANAGLSTHYKDWPGGSAILIPLSERSGKLPPLDTGALTEEKVIEELRKEEDMGLEERQQMVAIKEQEVSQSEQELAKIKENLAEKQTEVEEKAAELAVTEETIQKGEEELEESRRELESITDQEVRREKEQELREKEAEIEDAKEELARTKEGIEQERREIDETAEVLEKEEERLDEKKAEIESDRQSIERDERVLKAQEEVEQDPRKAAEQLLEKEEELKTIARSEPIAAGVLYYLKVRQYLSDGHYANDLYKINALTGEYISKAPPKPHIAGHKYDVIPDQGVLVLTQGESAEAHYLTLLDLETLTPVKTGNISIYHLSFIEKRGGYIFAINYKNSEDYRLGKYDDKTLNLVAESTEKIDKNTVFHMSGDLIFVNSADKRMLVLKTSDLSIQSVIDLP